MDDQKKDSQKQDEERGEVFSRRSFLVSLGKWSSIVIAAAAVGAGEALGSEVPKEEYGQAGGARPAREQPGPAQEADAASKQTEMMHGMWGHGCRVWGNGRRRRWGHGCRVWGNRF